jgi:hypothetical protein
VRVVDPSAAAILSETTVVILLTVVTVSAWVGALLLSDGAHRPEVVH